MKRWIIPALAAVMLFSASNSAHALISATLDVPVSYAFNDSDIETDGVSGTKIGISLPIFIGLALEKYEVTIKNAPGLSPISYAVSMYDFYIDLPFPFLNLGLGAGIGKGDLTGDGVNQYGPVPLGQWFATLGYPFLGLFDIHMGYHSISGKARKKGNPDIDMGATMYTVGFRVGF
ncbi:MAG: hypothetical protein OEZ59_00035 [Deltaproteobacteria bacterium]|nr:hypothetical protein [Deltaproteobacteria bacterium]